MIQFLNNIWIALTTENVELVNILLIPLGVIESYIFMNLILIIFKAKITPRLRLLCTLCIAILGLSTLSFIPSPLNVIINYVGVALIIRIFFKLNILKSLITLIISVFVFGLLNMLCQNPYLRVFNISFETFMYTPIYRIFYLSLLYTILFIISMFLKKFVNMDFSLELLDTLDNKTRKILYFNILVGFLSLGIQLFITTFYIDIVPIAISLLNFILLLFFLVLSIYTFTRIIKLAATQRELASAEEYNWSLQNLYDEVKCFKHDFNNIISTIDGYIETNDIDRLKKYFYEVKQDCKITNDLSLLNPSTINNPGIYSLLNNKYFKATNLGISFEIDFFLNLDSLDVNMYQFSRILGILIDNAIDEAEKCENKSVKLCFVRENRNNRALITIENTYTNKDVDIEKIFEKGKSGKENHSGIGLWEVKKYVSKSKNLDLFTSKTDDFFKQELSIYDII